MDQPPRGRPWLPWLIGTVLTLLGFAMGWLGPYLALRPVFAIPPAAKPARPPRPKAYAARVQGSPATVTAQPLDQVELQWTIVNVGDGPWPAHAYRFVSVGEEGPAPVVSLPRDLPAGAAAVIRAVLSVPPVDSPWRTAWELRGPRGPVPGARLEAVITIDRSMNEDYEP